MATRPQRGFAWASPRAPQARGFCAMIWWCGVGKKGKKNKTHAKVCVQPPKDAFFACDPPSTHAASPTVRASGVGWEEKGGKTLQNHAANPTVLASRVNPARSPASSTNFWCMSHPIVAVGTTRAQAI